MGGAQGLNYIIGMVRMKIVAILLGPSGIGLVGLYVSITGLMSTLAQLGIDQSGVREVAEAEGTKDGQRVAHAVKTLRRVCWLTGLTGWLLTVVLAWPISQWTFGSNTRTWAVAILGSTVFLGAISGGQTAILQGMRRVGDLAKLQVYSAVLTTLFAVGLYMWRGEDAIIPVIIATSSITFSFTWYFSSRIQLDTVSQSWHETMSNSKRLVGLGTAFMYAALLAAIVGLAIRALIVRELGLDASGLYQAAWGLSGMFAGFILGAMGTDFYPRISAVATDNAKVNRLVNEQIEVGVLLAVPGLLGTLALGPMVLHAFYSAKFIPAASLLPWFLLGVFGQVISWPLGMIQMAKGAQGWIYFSRTVGNVTWLSLTYVLIKANGLAGVCWSFAAYVWIQNAVVFCIARKLSNFHWSHSVMQTAGASTILVLSAFAVRWLPSEPVATGLILIATLAASIFSARGLTRRLGFDNKLAAIILKVPGMKWVCS